MALRAWGSIAGATALVAAGCAGTTLQDMLPQQALFIQPLPEVLPIVQNAQLYDPASRKFVSGGPMGEGRAFHTATVLTEGPLSSQVLIVGGVSRGGSTFLPAEVYDPAGDKFNAAAGHPTVDRCDHVAAVLKRGQVLLAGGMSSTVHKVESYDPATGAFKSHYASGGASAAASSPLNFLGGAIGSSLGVVATAQLYDPLSGGFGGTLPMLAGRLSPAITALRDGRVLIAGGLDPTGRSLATAELFDPSSGRFTATGSMAQGRAGAAVTLLQNGRVLIAGGLVGSGEVLATAELYDPSTGRFTGTGKMADPHVAAAATLLTTGKRAGQVLITGGWSEVAGGLGEALPSAELYNPRKGKFVAVGNMTSPRAAHAATRLSSGQVLITGGLENSGRVLATAELYEPAGGTFTAIGSMAEARVGHSATLLGDGRVLIAGGMSGVAPAR